MYEAEDGVLAGVSAGKCLVDCATLTPEHMVRTFRSHEYVYFSIYTWIDVTAERVVMLYS